MVTKLLLGLLIALGIALGFAYTADGAWFLPPSIRRGDLIVATSTTQAVRLATGTLGSVLMMNNNIPTWTATSSLGISGSLSGGTVGKVARWTSATALSTGILLDNATVAGVNATSSTVSFNIQGTGTLNPFNVASSSGTSYLHVTRDGNVGIGTTTPAATLEVTNDTLPFIVSGGGERLRIYAYGADLMAIDSDTGGILIQGVNGAVSLESSVSNISLLSGVNSTAAQDIILTGGTSTGNNNPGGDIQLMPGLAHGTGRPGFVGVNSSTPFGTLAVKARPGSFSPFWVTSSTDATLFQIGPNGSTTIANLTASACDVKSTTGGSLYCGSDATGASTGNAAWTILSGVIHNATSTDEVGVGTSTPTATLQVQGNGSTVPLTVSSSTGTTMFQIGVNASTTISSLGAGPVYSTSGGQLYTGTAPTGTASGTAGAIQFSTGSGGFDANDLFFWDNTNRRLGVNSTTPIGTLSVVGVNGVNPFEVASSTGAALLTVNQRGQLLAQSGSAAFPTYSFSGDPDTGIANTSSNILDFVAGGVVIAQLESTRLTIGSGKFISNQAGSAAAPSYTFGVDTDTGMFRDVANNLQFTTGGAERARFYPQGQFTIGTTTPLATLGVQGIASSTLPALVIASSTGLTMLSVGVTGTTTIANLTASACDLKSTTGGDLYCGVDATGASTGNAAWTIGSGLIYNATSTDLVGIGTITPTTTLFVQGKGGTNPFAIASSTGTQLLTVTQAGNVGIGSTTPAGKLGIVGDIYQNGTFQHFGDSICGTPNSAVVGEGMELCMDDNTTGGANLILSNKNAGTSAFVDIFMQNDLANAGGLNYAVINLNSSTYNDNTFGTAVNVPNQFLINNSVGPLAFMSSSSTGVSYIEFNTGGTAVGNERMRITSTGNVGIGSTAPVSLLAVQGTSSQPTLQLLSIASSTGTRLFTVASNGTVGIGTSTPAQTLTIVGNGTVDPFDVASSSGVSVLRVTTGRNVGIGTTTPATRLGVVGLQGANDVFDAASSTGTSLFRIRHDGKIGVGTTTPGSTLTVVGGLQVTGLASCTNGVITDVNGTISCRSKRAFIPVLGGSFLPDSSGNAYFEPVSITSSTAISLRGHYVFRDSGTKVCGSGMFMVPRDYNATAATATPVWTSATTTGNISWEFGYRTVAGDDSEILMYNTFEQTASTTDTAPTGVLRKLNAEIALTAANFAAGELAEYRICRDGTQSADTMAATATLQTILFEYDK